MNNIPFKQELINNKEFNEWTNKWKADLEGLEYKSLFQVITDPKSLCTTYRVKLLITHRSKSNNGCCATYIIHWCYDLWDGSKTCKSWRGPFGWGIEQKVNYDGTMD